MRRSVRRRPVVRALLLGLPLLALVAADGARALDLEGTWYVLIHYRDTGSAHPERVHWEDRLWHIERRGSRLVWTDHPLVVFEEQAGRWEGRRRTLGAWEPNEAQRLEIQRGLRANTRGRDRKTLRGSAEEGWSSATGARATGSAFTYQKTWRIDLEEGLPVFTFADTLQGTSSMEGASGVTRYVATAAEAGGRRIVGRYQRDERREGTFRMIRAGAPRDLPEHEKTPNERAAERARERMNRPSE